MWTENEGWYESWGYPRTHIRTFDDRPPEDMAYTVARWISVGGSHHNYYMYHGGNNYGRTASAGVTTMYADGVNLHSDGLSNEPKRSHLRRLHEALIACNDVLLASERQFQKPVDLGTNLTAFVYDNPHGRVVFLGNNNAKTDAVVKFEGKQYALAAKSIIILKNGKEIFNTADVETSFPIASDACTRLSFQRRRCDGKLGQKREKIAKPSWIRSLTSRSLSRAMARTSSCTRQASS
ncbi:hypothetical protein PINS_up015460 [Pythium insidiosum]|nr:hypothetical protein PINS_up015460 [Pythium insidiosum]